MTEQTHTPGAQDCIEWLQSWDDGSDPVWFRITRDHLQSIPTLAAEVEALKAENERLSGMVDRQAEQLETLLADAEICGLTEDLDLARIEADALRDTITRLESENATLKGERGELAARLRTLVDNDIVYDDRFINIACASHGDALRVVREARDTRSRLTGGAA